MLSRNFSPHPIFINDSSLLLMLKFTHKRLLISVLSIVPEPVSGMARDELRALTGGEAVWSGGMMDKTRKSSAASLATERERSIWVL